MSPKFAYDGEGVIISLKLKKRSCVDWMCEKLLI